MRYPQAVAAVAGVVVLTACTPRETAMWLEWWQQDPAAAEEFANTPDVQAELVEPEPTSRYGMAVWTDIAWCESGGRWDHPPVTNRTGTYSGGLMIGHRWWPAYGGGQYAPHPYQATRAEQIAVAENIADDAGLDAGWQCYG